MRKAEADIAIFGGGIAGLWLLNRLRQLGFSALLFDSGALGGGQTHKSQGIIHGGAKYVLGGKFNKDAQALANMPELWKQCLKGKGEIDLSNVPILSQQQYFWSPQTLTSKLMGFLASASLVGEVSTLPPEKFPSIFQHPQFKGEVHALDEMVIDVPSLIRELVKNNQDAVFKIEPLNDEELHFDQEGNLQSATIYHAGSAVSIHAQQFVFTAGAGNEFIAKRLNPKDLKTQRRPIHMVLVKTPFNYPLYAHCVGLGNRPRLTITTHYTHEGHPVWYLGGGLAEEGIERDSAKQIIAAKKELNALFPWLDFSKAEFATFMVDRAEPWQKGNVKPQSSYVKFIENVAIGWPTKLVLAPKLADDIIQHFLNLRLAPQLFDARELRAWPMPLIATPVWEDLFCKHVA